jgi:LCP family protein required for cell wall assembly
MSASSGGAEHDPPDAGTAGAGPTGFRARRRAKKAGRSKLRRRARRGGIALVLLVVVVVGGSIGYIYYRFSSISRVNVNVEKVPKTGIENILLVGSTSRCAVKPAKNFENFVQQCEDDVNGVNSDVIMILRLVPNKTPMLLSIPRDTFVPNARSGDLSNKVDAALADGPSQLVQAIEQDFGIPINHYVVLNFQTFANIVTALGGISMYFPTSLMDEQSGLNISHSGCLHISGLEALALVRARHVYFHYDRRTGKWLGYDGSGDLGRIERVHIFMKVLGAEVAARGLDNPVTDSKLLSAVAPDLTLDTTFGTHEILDLILADHSKIAATDEMTLPVSEDSTPYQYKGYPYGLVVFPSEPQDQDTIDKFMGDAAAAKPPKPSSISVSLVDAADAPATTSSIAAALRTLGFKATVSGAVTPVGSIAETEVVYAHAAQLPAAQQVLRSLSGLAVLAQGPTTGGADVTVVLGSDIAVSPAAVTTTAATSSSGLGAVPATGSALLTAMIATAANASLTPPTPSAPTIAPFDPRACPAK